MTDVELIDDAFRRFLLTTREHAVLMARYRDHLVYREIAQQMKLPHTTVVNAAYRGLRSLNTSTFAATIDEQAQHGSRLKSAVFGGKT